MSNFCVKAWNKNFHAVVKNCLAKKMWLGKVNLLIQSNLKAMTSQK